MYEEERLQKINEYIQSQTRASVHKLCNVFGVSESTIRRDLTELESRKLLKRTHGGAICLGSVGIEPTYNEKQNKQQQEKKLIAACASGLIENGDSLLIDSGTTTLCLVPFLKKFEQLTVVTNSIFIMEQLSNCPNIMLVCIGGFLRSNTMALVGPVAEETLNHLRLDKAFMATNGIEFDMGLTTPNMIEASIKAQMIRSSEHVYVLADHTKVGRVSFAKFGTIDDIDGCITTHDIPAEQQQKFESKGVKLYFADDKQEQNGGIS